MSNFVEIEAGRKFYGQRKSGPPQKGCVYFPPYALGGPDHKIRRKKKLKN